MANRVLLNQSGLKISKPGFNVLTTPPGNLIFSSDFSALTPYRSGTHTYTWSGISGNSSHSANVALGKTFATPPLVFFQHRLNANEAAPLGDASGFYHVREYEDDDQNLHLFEAWATVSTTQISFGGFYTRSSNMPIAFTVGYSIYEYNL